jgi:DtxR family Mn-dependent transcriptional regulator
MKLIYTNFVATSTVEQYVKKIYQLEEPGKKVQTQAVAEALEVTPGTATVMIKHLSKLRLVDYTPRYGVTLTQEGISMAVRLLRYHRLIETFLVNMLGYDWSEIHEEAEILEHAVSERFIQRIDALLQYPKIDPHGDPIPNAEGRITPDSSIPLVSANPGTKGVICRFIKTNPEILVLMDTHGLHVGVEIHLTDQNPIAGTLTIQGPKGQFTMGSDLASKILIEPKQ